MKNILITGAGGFIGSHLTELCVQKGYRVKAFLRYNSNSLKGWLENSDYKNDIEFILGDIRDYDSVHSAMKDCDTVFHLAALIGIPYSYVSPLAYIKTNVEGTYNVLESARRLSTGNVIVTSTSETYGSAQYVPIDEKHPANAQSPYAASKVAADQLALSYYRSFDLPVKVIRPFNTFGPRQSMRAIIPTVIAQILHDKKELKLGNTTPMRDFTFVKDTTAAFIELAKHASLNGDVTNVGMKQEISIKDVVDRIATLLNSKVKISEDDKRVRPGKSEVDRLFCENAKILKNTGWRPQYNLDQALTETIDWMRANLEKMEADAYRV